MPGMSHFLLVVQSASAAGHRTCLSEVPAEADLVRNYQGTVLRPALSRRGDGRGPDRSSWRATPCSQASTLRLQLPGWPGSQE